MRQRAFSVTPRSRPRLGGGAGGGFTLLAALERMVERQAVVARRYRLVGLRERRRRRRELGRGILFGSGRTCRGDRATGLADLLVGRLATRDADHRDEARCRAQESATHST